MKKLEVYYHTLEQLNFITACLKKGPSFEEIVRYKLTCDLLNSNSHSLNFLDMEQQSKEETEETLMAAMHSFTFITIKKHGEVY